MNINQEAMNQLTKIHYSKSQASLQLSYADGTEYQLSAEYLRVYSPSAEVRGHGNAVLQTGKKDVQIWQLEPVGNYALKISFNDGHDSGLYTWEYLQELGQNQAAWWQDYLNRLAAAGESRQPKLIPLAIDASK